MFQTKFVEKNLNSDFMFNIFSPSQKLCRVLENVEEYGRVGQATHDSLDSSVFNPLNTELNPICQ